MTAIDGMCRASDLRYLVNTKQFTMIPSHLLRYLQMEAGIGLDEFGMWVAIYDLVAADPELQRPITWGFLAKRFGFSEKTAKRTCKRLIDKNLLVIESRHREDGSQIPSLFKIRVTRKVAARLLTETPDRIKQSDNGDEERNEQSGSEANRDQLPSKSTVSAGIAETSEPKNSKTRPSFKTDERRVSQPILETENLKSQPCVNGEDRKEKSVSVRSLLKNLSAGIGKSSHGVDEKRLTVSVSNDDVDGECAGVDVSAGCVDGVRTAVDVNASPVNASETPVNMSRRESNSVNGQILLIGAEMKNCALADRLEAARKRSVFAQEKRSDEKRPDVAGQLENVTTRVLDAGEISTKKGEDKAGRGEGVQIGHQEKTPFEEKPNNNSLTKMIARKLADIGLKFERVVALTCEVQASIERGSLKKFSLNHALNIAAKLIKEGRWTAPRLAYR